MKISQNLLKKIEDEARAALPREACGFLVGTPGGDEILDAVPSRNLADDPETFLIDTARHLKLQRRLRSGGQAVIGIYHSHPSGDSEPSPVDIKAFQGLNLDLIIVAVNDQKPPKTRLFGSFLKNNAPLSATFVEKRLQTIGFVA